MRHNKLFSVKGLVMTTGTKHLM